MKKPNNQNNRRDNRNSFKSSNDPFITKYNVRIVSPEEHKGNYSRREAIELAKQLSLDLQEVNVAGETSFCKLLDLNKEKYEKNKREREAKKANKKRKNRKITFSYQADSNDLKHKTNTAFRLVKEGDIVEITVQMKGREAQLFEELGRDKLQQALDMIKENAREQDLSIKISPINVKPVRRSKDIFATVQANVNDSRSKGTSNNSIHRGSTESNSTNSE